MSTQSYQPLEGLALHDCSSKRPLDCSLKLAYVFAVELCGLVVEGVLGVWLVEQVDKAVDDRVDIQHLPDRRVYSVWHWRSKHSQKVHRLRQRCGLPPLVSATQRAPLRQCRPVQSAVEGLEAIQ